MQLHAGVDREFTELWSLHFEDEVKSRVRLNRSKLCIKGALLAWRIVSPEGICARLEPFRVLLQI